MKTRYAVYFTPPAARPLGRFGRAWLDSVPAAAQDPPARCAATLTPARLVEITRAPRHYGFHATLKPPFALADGCRIADLERAVADFAAARPRFVAPPLDLATLAGFIALMLRDPSTAMASLATDCVAAFDRFRRPAAPAEIARRRAVGLTPRQERYLTEWGYPYVMEEFRFHMTLTGRLEALERARVLDRLRPLVAPLCREPFIVDGITLFEQADRSQPFRLRRRYRLAA